MKIREIIQIIEETFPLHLQENYDNCGYQVGNPEEETRGVLTCVDITEAVLQEAMNKNCNLIIAHHPLLFHGLKNITGESYIERCVQLALQNNLTIYAAHTNVDNAIGGINYILATDFGLSNVEVLEQKQGEALGVGAGIIGDLPKAIEFNDFLLLVKEYFQSKKISYSKEGSQSIRRVAICGGAGAYLWREARIKGADILITGEAKYNDYFNVEGRPRLLTVGHYESEQIVAKLFLRVISDKLPTFTLYKTDLDSNPITSV